MLIHPREGLRHPGLLIGRLVLVDDTLGSRFVERAGRHLKTLARGLHVSGLLRGFELLYVCLERRLDALVADALILGLAHPFPLRLDVRHYLFLLTCVPRPRTSASQ